MKNKNNSSQDQKMDQIVNLLQTLVAMEMSKGDVPQDKIGKLLGISAGSVNALIKGYKGKKK